MTHHDMKKEQKKMGASGSMPEYESEMKKRGQEIQEGRIKEKEAGAHMLETGMGGPEAEGRSGRMSAREGTPEYESEMKKRGQELQEARKREKEAGAHMLETGMGGPEAEEKHTMQTEAPTTLRASKGGYAEAGSKGSETVKRSRGQK